MRSIRRLSQVVVSLFGASIVVYAMYYVTELRERVLFASLGLLIMEIGIWQITAFLFPNDRANRALRKETDYFLKLVRRLNRAALAVQRGSANAQSELDRVHEDMHHSVDRMLRLAGAGEHVRVLGEVSETLALASQKKP